MKRLLLLLVLVGCGTARRGATVAAAPVALDAKAAQGERVFMKQCHQCHPFGEGGLGPPINNRSSPRWSIKLQVRSGFGAMPAFDQRVLPPDELDAVVEYLVDLRRVQPLAVR